MANYVQSSGVSVFPSSLRSGEYSSGKFTTEYNLTSFLKAVTDNKSFVIADPNATIGSPQYNANYYVFVLNGFCFEVAKTAIEAITPGATNIYASIRLDADGRLLSWDGSIQLDDATYCTALYIDTAAPVVEFTHYTVNLKAADRYAKFTTDSFNINGQSLTAVLNDKQPLIKDEAGRRLALNQGLVTGVLPVANGGTGVSNLDNAVVGKAQHMVDSNGDVLNTGSTDTPVYFAGGVPYATSVVNGAQALKNSSGTAISAGSATQPVYFNNGVPTAIGSSISAHAAGLNEGKGAKDTSTPTQMYFTGVYFDNNGNAQPGIKINMSTSTPTGAIGSAGDLWFKYQA